MLSPATSLTLLQDADPDFPIPAVQALLRQYEQWLRLWLDFPGFGRETDDLPGRYATTRGGRLYLALRDGQPAGCAAFHRLSPDVCELKRLFVAPARQGDGVGRRLVVRAIADARAAGYRRMTLDSLRRMASARRLYESLGFEDIAPYNDNPYPDAYHMALDL